MRSLTLSLSLAFALVACAEPDGTDTTPEDGLDDVEDVVDEEPGPDLPDGTDDSFAERACELLGATPTSIIAAASAGEAGQALIVPDESDKAYEIQLPETGAGFVTVEIGDWMTTVRFFTDDLAEYTVDGGAENLTGLRNNGACPDERTSDARWAFHEWGSYTLEFDAESPRTIWFVALKES